MGKENYEHCNYKIKYFVEFDNATRGISYLYNTENKKYIKVKSTSGKYGYIKVGSNMLFTKNSCLWWR